MCAKPCYKKMKLTFHAVEFDQECNVKCLAEFSMVLVPSRYYNYSGSTVAVLCYLSSREEKKKKIEIESLGAPLQLNLGSAIEVPGQTYCC